MILTGLASLSAAGNLVIGCTVGYAALTAVARTRGIRQSKYPGAMSMPVTVLKPLCGDEPDLYENLRSFCEQTHPEFQLVLGTNRDDDTALVVADRLKRDYPALDIVVCRHCPPLGCNRKVANLSNLYAQARHPWVVIADSDIRVPRDYLERVTAPLSDDSVGLVTCLYRACPSRRLRSRLAGHYIEDWFRPSVLVAQLLGGRQFAFGATIAMRCETLDRLGGFAAIADHLADDYKLGESVYRAGMATVLSECEVETTTHHDSWRELLTHEKRWMRTIRLLQPFGYLMAFITMSLPLAFFGDLVSGGQANWLVATGLILAIRCSTRAIESRRHGFSAMIVDTALVPVRDGLTALAWIRGLFGRRVNWRDQQYTIERGGALRSLTSGKDS